MAHRSNMGRDSAFAGPFNRSSLALLSLLPAEATAPFRVARYAGIGASVETAIGLNIVVVTLAALVTAAGEAQNMRTVRWSWIGLWAIVLFGVLFCE